MRKTSLPNAWFSSLSSYRTLIDCFIIVYAMNAAYAYLGFRTGLFGLLERGFRPRDLWVVNEKQEVVASRNGNEPPESWRQLPMSQENRSKSKGPAVTLIRDPRDPRLYWMFDSSQPSLWKMLFTLFYRGFPISIGSFILCAYILRSRSRKAEEVMKAIKGGELGARIPVDHFDELGRLTMRFNEMADQIENLIKKLRLSEQSRNHLIQELTHDLRTPLTSVYMLIGSIADPDSNFPIEKIRAKMNVARAELEYFRKLIDDLFLIAQVNELASKGEPQEVDLLEIMEEEIEKIRSAQFVGGKIDFEVFSSSPCYVLAEVHLIRRLFRNALENSARFAKSKVQIRFDASTNKDAVVIVSDDGPGFSFESIENFGQKRPARAVDVARPGRISLGLGSVIMTSIAEAYRGKILIGNRPQSSAGITGAEVRIILPAISSAAKMVS